MTKEKYIHPVSLNAEQEARLRAQREKGRTIIGLLILGILAAESGAEKEK